jgi:hypothetical protein
VIKSGLGKLRSRSALPNRPYLACLHTLSKSPCSTNCPSAKYSHVYRDGSRVIGLGSFNIVIILSFVPESKSGAILMRRITTLLLLLVLTTNSISSAKSENIVFTDEISIACNGGTYTVWMPAGYLTKNNGCTGSLAVDSSVKYIGDGAFKSSKITSLVLPNSVTYIGPNAFADNRNLKSVSFPNSIESIGNSAFSYTGLTSIVIPGNSLKSIGYYAFDRTALSSADIPHSVATAIYAFSTDGSLKSIIYCGPLRGFPISPTCPPDRKAIIDAADKAAADKAAAEKAAAEKAAAEKAAADKAAADKAAADKAAARAEEDFSCLNFKVINDDGIWSVSEGPKVTKAVVTWSIFDPGNCIISAPQGSRKELRGISWQSTNNVSGNFDANWTSERNGDNYAIILDFDIPNSWLQAVSNTQGVYANSEMRSAIGYLNLYEFITRKVSSIKSKTETIKADIQSDNLWGLILSNRQKLERNDCSPEKSKDSYFNVAVKSVVEVLKAGDRPTVNIELSDPSNCIFMVYTPPIGRASTDKLLNIPFWGKDGYRYWNNLVGASPSLIRVSGNVFGEYKNNNPYSANEFVFEKDALPISSSDSVALVGNKIKITSEIDLSGIDKSSITKKSEAQIVIGAYAKYDAVSSCYSGSWRVNWTSSNSFTVRYSSGGCTPSGLKNSYQVISIKVPLLDLIEKNGVANAEAKAAAAKDAEAKLAAELKVKRDAAEQKLVDEVVALVDEIYSLGNKFPSQTYLLDSYSKFLSEWLVTPSWYRDYVIIEREISRISTEIRLLEVDWSKSKKTTITCVKGKLTKKVTAIKPVCPKGYKKK